MSPSVNASKSQTYDNSNNGQLTSSDQDKVEVLSNFFASVYTMKTDTEIPELQCKDLVYEMPLPDMRRELIEKLLKDLKVSKSPGPDGIYPTSNCFKRTCS